MKKIIFPILMITFIASITFAGPFGLSKGMSVEEISKLCEKGCEPTNPDGDDKYIFVPKKKHELFKLYVAAIDEDKGLYGIIASTDEIPTKGYGTELKNSFNSMVERLSRIYGKPKIIDTVVSDSLLEQDEYWLFSLERGARELSATWEKGEKGTNLPEELDSVSILTAAKHKVGFVIIKYRFSNVAEVQEKQDDVL